jgi:hypothetical protein
MQGMSTPCRFASLRRYEPDQVLRDSLIHAGKPARNP